MNIELQRCPGCQSARLAAGPQWCKCNPSAPFRMMPAAVTETVDALFASIEEKSARLTRIRSIKAIGAPRGAGRGEK